MYSILQSIKKLVLVAVVGISSLVAFAEIGVSELPIKTINGKQYHYYEVMPQETVYSLCRKFDISREELIAANPSVADGLKAYQTLLFPVKKTQEESISSKDIDYQVQRGETGYGISRKFSMTLADFYQLNPNIAEGGLKAGMIVKVRKSEGQTDDATILPQTHSNVDDNQQIDVNKNGQAIYKVKSGDTFFGIAQRYGLGVEQLRNANPEVDVLKEGMTITLPQSCNENQSIEVGPSQSDLLATHSDRHRLECVEDVVSDVDTLVIALVLPLKASTVKRDVRATNSMEFYRGFMLAVDSLRNYGKPLKILTYDTNGSDQSISEILSTQELGSAQVILAPDVISQMNSLAEYAEINKIYLLNQFIIKDQSYLTNPYMIQSNIPQKTMYQKAIDYYLNSFPTSVPVFLKRTDGKTDKEEFVGLLKNALSEAGRKYHEIEFKDKLSLTTLSQLPQGVGYAFIPVSSTIKELNCFVSAVSKFKAERLDSNICVWGYAEWLTARGGTLEALHNANAYIFSRFFSVDKDFAQEELQNKFRYWYGVGISDRVPRQGVYGFDTGMYLIRALNVNNGDFSRYPSSYFGIQNSFEFIHQPEGGLVNDEMFIINFAPGTAIFKFGI